MMKRNSRNESQYTQQEAAVPKSSETKGGRPVLNSRTTLDTKMFFLYVILFSLALYNVV